MFQSENESRERGTVFDNRSQLYNQSDQRGHEPHMRPASVQQKARSAGLAARPSGVRILGHNFRASQPFSSIGSSILHTFRPLVWQQSFEKSKNQFRLYHG